MVKVVIPTVFKQYMGQGKTRISIDAETVSEALRVLISGNNRLQSHIVEDLGNLSEFVNIFLDREEVRYLSGQYTGANHRNTLRIGFLWLLILEKSSKWRI